MPIDTSELLETLFRLEWLLRYRHMRIHRERGPMGDVHRGQGRILALLKLSPQMSQKELSSILDIRSQSLGELLAKLERQGLITRSPSAQDKRAVDISLTEAGRAAAEEGGGDPEGEALFGCLTEEERESLAAYLGRLIEAWEKDLGQEAPLPGGGFGRGPRGGFPGGFPGGFRGRDGRDGHDGHDGHDGPGGRGGRGYWQGWPGRPRRAGETGAGEDQA